MNLIAGAIICGLSVTLIIVACTLPIAIANGWLRVRSVVVSGKDFDTTKAVEKQECLHEVCERPQVALTPIDEDEARIARIKEKMKSNTIPTLPGKGQTSYVPIRAYKDREEITKNHNLEILN